MYTTCATCTKLLCHSCRVLVLELTVCVTYSMIFVLVLLVCATYVAAISVSASVLYSAILANTVANVNVIAVHNLVRFM